MTLQNTLTARVKNKTKQKTEEFQSFYHWLLCASSTAGRQCRSSLVAGGLSHLGACQCCDLMLQLGPKPPGNSSA